MSLLSLVLTIVLSSISASSGIADISTTSRNEYVNLAPRWGYDGHRIVCQIAWFESDPHTQEAIRKLLDLDSEFDSFPESCLWADEIRRDPQYKRFPTAHYLNVPRGDGEVDISRDCRDTYCVVEGIVDMKAILEGDGFNGQERLEALKFLSHFVGDVHQPLHAGYGDDRGGNGTDVTLWGNDTNLHRVWDYMLIEHRGLDWEAYADTLEASITDEQRARWNSTGPEDWADESFEIVKDSVYDLPADHAIGEAYYRSNIAAIGEQLRRAGVRLAHTLDLIFDKEH